MPTKGPMNMEDGISDVPTSIEGREVDPDKDETTAPNTEAKTADAHMTEVLKHVPAELKERVSKLERAELSLPGVPRDREAYEAYLSAEKMIRDLRRREQRANFSWKGLPKKTG